MDKNEIELKIVSFLSRILHQNATKIRVSDRLLQDLNLDSLDVVELVLELEAIFNIEIADDDIDRFKTVRDLVEYVSDRLNPAAI